MLISSALRLCQHPNVVVTVNGPKKWAQKSRIQVDSSGRLWNADLMQSRSIATACSASWASTDFRGRMQWSGKRDLNSRSISLPALAFFDFLR